jgi:hypothetical protein
VRQSQSRIGYFHCPKQGHCEQQYKQPIIIPQKIHVPSTPRHGKDRPRCGIRIYFLARGRVDQPLRWHRVAIAVDIAVDIRVAHLHAAGIGITSSGSSSGTVRNGGTADSGLHGLMLLLLLLMPLLLLLMSLVHGI